MKEDRVPKKTKPPLGIEEINKIVSDSLSYVRRLGNFSDAAKVAASLGKDWVFKSDWKKVFKPEMLRKAIEVMLHPEKVNVQ